MVLAGSLGGAVSSVPSKTSFKVGDTAAITAVAKDGYVFAYWADGEVADPTAAVTSVVVESNLEITAVFRAAPGAQGAFSDNRDGSEYQTTQIGPQTWMGQNMNYKTGNSWCYNDSDRYCEKYGRLYDWSTAKTVCPAGWHLPSRAEWDILARSVLGKKNNRYDDDDRMWGGAGKASALKTAKGWNQDGGDDGNGTDDYGFSAMPGGAHRDMNDYHGNDDVFDDDGGDDESAGGESAGTGGAGVIAFAGIGDIGLWWTATAGDDGSAVVVSLSNNEDDLSADEIDIGFGASARCVADSWIKQPSSLKPKPPSKAGKPKIEMVFVKGGTFTMGYVGGETCNCYYTETGHNVTVGDFYIGKYEVTQKQWLAIMESNPSVGPIGDNYPVNNISADDMEDFIERLNAATGKKYRLPTEAQWEYAARGGANSKGYEYPGGDDPDALAWYKDNGGGEAHPVGTKAPNELGIYDMSGNVWEKTRDWMGDYGVADETDPAGPATGVNRVARGCSWRNVACRVFQRGFSSVGQSGYDSGFRLVLPP
ncbi:hypothetical protein R80B4_00009 [Fibrobacteres bacterium R8-0-B4]